DGVQTARPSHWPHLRRHGLVRDERLHDRAHPAVAGRARPGPTGHRHGFDGLADRGRSVSQLGLHPRPRHPHRRSAGPVRGRAARMVLLVASLGLALATGGTVGSAGDITPRLVPGLFVSGRGRGLFAPGITEKMRSWAPENAVGGVSGTVNAVIQLSGSLGTVAAGSLFFLALPDGETGLLTPAAADTAGLVALLYPLGGFVVASLLAVALHRRERRRPP